jgi:hypothetical protein
LHGKANVTPQNAPLTTSNTQLLNKIDRTDWDPATGRLVSRDYLVPSDFENVRRTIQGDIYGTAAGASASERRGAKISTDVIDSILSNPPPGRIHPTSLNDPSLVGLLSEEARGNRATAERLGYLRGTGEDTAFKAAVGDNIGKGADAMRKRVAAAVSEYEKGRGPLSGFSPNEAETLAGVAKGSAANRVGRFVAKGMPTSIPGAFFSGAPAGAAIIGNYMGFDPHTMMALGAAVPAAGVAGKIASKIGTRMAFKRAQQLVASRSPLAEQLGIPAPAWEYTKPPSALRRDAIAAALTPRYTNMLPAPSEENQ